MNKFLNRRSFLESASKTALISSAFSAFLWRPNIINKRFTLGLSQYSLRALLRNGSLDPLDFPKFTFDEFGIKAIDLWEGGLPKDKLDDSQYLATMRKKADQAGTDLFLLMSGALDASKEKREASAKRIKASFNQQFNWVHP